MEWREPLRFGIDLVRLCACGFMLMMCLKHFPASHTHLTSIPIGHYAGCAAQLVGQCGQSRLHSLGNALTGRRGAGGRQLRRPSRRPRTRCTYKPCAHYLVDTSQKLEAKSKTRKHVGVFLRCSVCPASRRRRQRQHRGLRLACTALCEARRARAGDHRRLWLVHHQEWRWLFSDTRRWQPQHAERRRPLRWARRWCRGGVLWRAPVHCAAPPRRAGSRLPARAARVDQRDMAAPRARRVQRRPAGRDAVDVPRLRQLVAATGRR